MTPERTIYAGEVFDGTIKLAEVLDRVFHVDRSTINLHTDTLVSIVGHSDALLPSEVRFSSDKKRVGIVFKNPELGRELIVWLGFFTRGDVTVENPDGIRTGSEKHFKNLFAWLNEGKPKTNHAKTKIADEERKFHPPFMCGYYKAKPDGKEMSIGKKLLEGESIREIYDKFRKLYPTGSYILVINALKRTGQKPNDVGELCLGTGLLEKAFYHGG